MEQNVCICIISNIYDTQSTRTYENAQCKLILTAPVAETSLVHYAASDVHCTANTIPFQSGSVPPECMAAINKQFRSKGFSKKVSIFCQHHGGRNTKRLYIQIQTVQ